MANQRATNTFIFTPMEVNVTKSAVRSEIDKVRSTVGISRAEQAAWIVELEGVLAKLEA